MQKYFFVMYFIAKMIMRMSTTGIEIIFSHGLIFHNFVKFYWFEKAINTLRNFGLT